MGLLRTLHHFVVRPLRILLRPAIDPDSGLKAARLRYYKVRIEKGSGAVFLAYQEMDTSGRTRHLRLQDGRRYSPAVGDHISRVDSVLHSPPFAGIDWKEVWKR